MGLDLQLLSMFSVYLAGMGVVAFLCHVFVRRYWLACLTACGVMALFLVVLVGVTFSLPDLAQVAMPIIAMGVISIPAGIPVVIWRRVMMVLTRGERGLCRKCEYDLRGTINAGRSVCPECGTPIKYAPLGQVERGTKCDGCGYSLHGLLAADIRQCPYCGTPTDR